MYRILLSLLILGCVFSITACDSLGFLQTTPSPDEREAEEYAVYRAILGGETNLCIASHTTLGHQSCEYPELEPKLINDYKAQNQVSVQLKPELDLGVAVIPSGDEFFVHSDCEFKKDCICDPQSVSRVGFNPQMNQALVFWARNAPLAGRGEWIYLVKGIFGIWKIEETILCWIS
jgi:hypothetical protein